MVHQLLGRNVIRRFSKAARKMARNPKAFPIFGFLTNKHNILIDNRVTPGLGKQTHTSYYCWPFDLITPTGKVVQIRRALDQTSPQDLSHQFTGSSQTVKKQENSN